MPAFIDSDPTKTFRMTTHLAGPCANVNPPPDYHIDQPIPFEVLMPDGSYFNLTEKTFTTLLGG